MSWFYSLIWFLAQKGHVVCSIIVGLGVLCGAMWIVLLHSNDHTAHSKQRRKEKEIQMDEGEDELKDVGVVRRKQSKGGVRSEAD